MTLSKKLLTLSTILLTISVSTVLAEKPQRRGVIGLSVRDPDQAGQAGAEVVRIDMDSPAYASHIRPKDLITHVNNKPVTSAADYAAMIERVRAGSEWRYRLLRNNQKLEVKIVAAEAPREIPSLNITIEYTWFIADDGVQLRGVITKPSTGEGPWPAMFIIPGIGGIPCDDANFLTYRKLAQTLSARGYLVVRYDPRGAGDSLW